MSGECELILLDINEHGLHFNVNEVECWNITQGRSLHCGRDDALGMGVNAYRPQQKRPSFRLKRSGMQKYISRQISSRNFGIEMTRWVWELTPIDFNKNGRHFDWNEVGWRNLSQGRSLHYGRDDALGMGVNAYRPQQKRPSFRLKRSGMQKSISRQISSWNFGIEMTCNVWMLVKSYNSPNQIPISPLSRFAHA